MSKPSVLIILLVAVIGLTACGTRFDLAAYEQQLISEGEELYLLNCSRCHHLDGEGLMPIFPRLAGNPLVTLHDPVPIIEVVLHGQGSMPAFRNDLSAEETAQILSYIRNAWGNSASVVYPKQAQ